jgi:hypothetical protein
MVGVDCSEENIKKYHDAIIELVKIQDTMVGGRVDKRMKIEIHPFKTVISMRFCPKGKPWSSRTMCMEYVANFEYIINTVKELMK